MRKFILLAPSKVERSKVEGIKILKLIILLAVCGLGFFAFSAEAQAATYYVDDNPGSNCAGNYSIVNRNCSGSNGNSYATIQSAVNAATGGSDTINIRAGTYNERIANITSGTTIQGYNGEKVIVDGGRDIDPNGWSLANPDDCMPPAGCTPDPNIPNDTHCDPVKCPDKVFKYNISLPGEVVYMSVMESDVSKHLYNVIPNIYAGDIGPSCYYGDWAEYLGLDDPNRMCVQEYTSYPLKKISFWGGSTGLFAYRNNKLFVGFRDKALNPSIIAMKYSLRADKCFDLSDKDSITISNMTVQNCFTLIYIESSSNNKILNNYLGNAGYKIFSNNANNNLIKNNILESIQLGDQRGGALSTSYGCFLQPKIYGQLVQDLICATSDLDKCYCAAADQQKSCATEEADPIKECNSDVECGSEVKCVERNGGAKVGNYYQPKLWSNYPINYNDRENKAYPIFLAGGQDNKIYKNSISNSYMGIFLDGGYNTDIGGNSFYNIVSGCISFTSQWPTETKVHDNLFFDFMLGFDFKFLNTDTKTYVYNNRIYNPPYHGYPFFAERLLGGSISTLPTIYFYHNSFSGGDAIINYCDGPGGINLCQNMELINNIISTPRVMRGPRSVDYAAGNALYGRRNEENIDKQNNLLQNGGLDKTASVVDFKNGIDSFFWPMKNVQAWNDLPYWFKGWTDPDTAGKGHASAAQGLPGFSGTDADYYEGTNPNRGWVGYRPAPANLVGDSPSAGKANLTWSAPTRSGRTIDDFTILRKLSTNDEYATIATQTGTTFSDNNVPGATYNYTVQANYDDGSVSILANAAIITVGGGGDNPADVNNDTKVNIKDIQEVIRCIINSQTCAFSERSDVNNDERINIKDIQEIIREIINP